MPTAEAGGSSSPAGSGEAGTESGHRHSILVVDDQSNIRHMIRNILEAEGYDVQVAADGEEGIAAFRKDTPHLIISDYQMPGMDGLDLLVQARESAPDTARMLCTGYANLEVALTAINKGAVSRILVKPFDPEDLLGSVQDCLEPVRLRMENTELLVLTQSQNDKLTGWNQALEKEVTLRIEHLQRVTEASIYSLAELAESRA
ncbi:MAG: response regulator [bacterium]